MRERAERERRTKEKKGQPLVKREKVKHHGDKRHRRGILSVAGLLLTGIRARGGIRKTGRQESPTIPVKTENIFLSIREGTGGGGGIASTWTFSRIPASNGARISEDGIRTCDEFT